MKLLRENEWRRGCPWRQCRLREAHGVADGDRIMHDDGYGDGYRDDRNANGDGYGMRQCYGDGHSGVKAKCDGYRDVKSQDDDYGDRVVNDMDGDDPGY